MNTITRLNFSTRFVQFLKMLPNRKYLLSLSHLYCYFVLKLAFICRVKIDKWAEVAGQASDQWPYLSTGTLDHWISKYFNQNQPSFPLQRSAFFFAYMNLSIKIIHPFFFILGHNNLNETLMNNNSSNYATAFEISLFCFVLGHNNVVNEQQ